MTRIVYICGLPRSGSQLLGSLLGSLEGFVFVGECNYVWRAILAGATCSCGRPHRDCAVWSRVLEPDLGGIHDPDPVQVMRLQEAAVPRRHSWWRTWSFLRGSELSTSTPAGRYARLVADMYERMAAATGARVIVDSSKDPAIAALLRRVPNLALTLVQLVRDPRGNVFSHLTRASSGIAGHPHPARTTYASMAWLSRHLASQEVRRAAGGAGMLVRYEDYVEAPVDVLREIAARTGVSVPSVPVAGDQAELSPGHRPGGGLRRPRLSAGTVALRRQDGWRDELHPVDRCLATAITLPLLRRYGYPVNP